jgi:hypothetical protein
MSLHSQLFTYQWTTNHTKQERKQFHHERKVASVGVNSTVNSPNRRKLKKKKTFSSLNNSGKMM